MGKLIKRISGMSSSEVDFYASLTAVLVLTVICIIVAICQTIV